MWKLLCGNGAVESCLGYLADVSTNLFTGIPDMDESQQRITPDWRPVGSAFRGNNFGVLGFGLR